MSILIFIIILAVLVLIHEAGHFFAAKKSGVKVEEFGFGFPPRLYGIKRGETLYSINLIPLGGFVRLYQEEYHEEKKPDKKLKARAFIYKSPLAKAFIVTAGILGNVILAWVLLSYLLTQGVPVPTGHIFIDTVQPQSPASIAGLQKGDKLIRFVVNKHTYQVSSTQEFVNDSKRFAGAPLELEITRRNVSKTVFITPRKNPPKGQGAFGIIIGVHTVQRRYLWYEAPYAGLKETINRTEQIVTGLFSTLGELLRFQKPTADVAGPIGIARLTGKIVQYGFNSTLEFIAMLSLNLAVINILPFPALDGGRLMFVIYEWIFRRRMNKSVEQYANLAGMIILLTLALIVSISDVAKIMHP